MCLDGFWVLSDLISFKQEDFRLGKTHSRPSEQIFAQANKKLKNFIFTFESLRYYFLLFSSQNSKFSLKI